MKESEEKESDRNADDFAQYPKPDFDFNLLREHVNGLGTNTDEKEKIKRIWDEILVTNEPPEEISLIKIGETPVATAGNHSLVTGKKKSRKTLFIVWLLSNFQGEVDKDILIFDTEQGRRHVWQIREKIHLLTGKSVPVFFLRGKSPEERKDIIEKTIQYWPNRPKLIIIDGIRDLVSNINDADECTELITWLEKITVEEGLHFINVLHQNKIDSNARGHLGTELQNKAETIISVKLNKEGYSVVDCESSRDIPFNSFGITHGNHGLPVLVDFVNNEIISEDEEKKRLKFVFEEGVIRYTEVIENIKIHFEVKETKAKNLLAKFQRKGLIAKINTGGKTAKYQLMF